MSDSAASAKSPSALTSKTFALWGLLALQTICAAFFLADAIADLFGTDDVLGGLEHDRFELIVVIALLLGIVLTTLEIRKIMRRSQHMQVQLDAASGAFFTLVEAHFDVWSLTPSERDVALLAIKGLSIAEIAEVRQTKEGTIKAQCNAIYRKADVTGRPQLLSLFIEELMGRSLLDREMAAQ